MEIAVFLIIWTLLSITWFLRNIGHKHKGKDTLVDYIMSPPALALAFIGGYIIKWSQRNKKN